MPSKYKHSSYLRLVVDNSVDETANRSASDKSTSVRRAASKRGKKWRGGTPRCLHFLNASPSTPISAARPRKMFHLSIGQEYGDDPSPLSTPAQPPPKRPSKNDTGAPECGMGSTETESDFNAVFRLRTQRARKAAKLTQQEVATALGVALDTYKKWENRPTSAVPRDKMLAFCIVTRIRCDDMLQQPSNQELAAIRRPEKKRA